MCSIHFVKITKGFNKNVERAGIHRNAYLRSPCIQIMSHFKLFSTNKHIKNKVKSLHRRPAFIIRHTKQYSPSLFMIASFMCK
eukprot:Gb_12003 [translate_table: standard]